MTIQSTLAAVALALAIVTAGCMSAGERGDATGPVAAEAATTIGGRSKYRYL